MKQLTERFIRYAKIDTRSDASSSMIPTTQSQVEFAKMLVEDLKEIGLSDVLYNPENGFVTATLPSNTDKDVASIGFIAHIDTADFNSVNIQPRIVENYDGQDIILNKDLNITMSPTMFPNLKTLLGHDLIVTDGTTLLGADDKAGMAEIIEAAAFLINNPDIKHGKVRLAFGPDEEIGRGADNFDASGFDVEFAYTVDGSRLGELEYECFNAAQADITLKGVSVHPGTARDKMINTAKLAFEFDSQLPQDQVPEMTEGYEGFYLLHNVTTTIEDGEMIYIIRDHDRKLFEEKKQRLQDIAGGMNEKYGYEAVKVLIQDSYYNMADVIVKDMRPVDYAKKAMANLDITPIIQPIRGGTDGSKISFMGIPTPNLFTGGENYHGKYEFASIQVMEKAKQTIIEIIKEVAR